MTRQDGAREGGGGGGDTLLFSTHTHTLTHTHTHTHARTSSTSMKRVTVSTDCPVPHNRRQSRPVPSPGPPLPRGPSQGPASRPRAWARGAKISAAACRNINRRGGMSEHGGAASVRRGALLAKRLVERVSRSGLSGAQPRSVQSHRDGPLPPPLGSRGKALPERPRRSGRKRDR